MSNLSANVTPAEICVIRLSAIGDTCHALAVVRRLQDNWPGSRITWIIGKTEASLMSGITDVEFIIFDKSKGRQAYYDVKRQLRGRDFDVALCMHASLRVNLLYRHISTGRKIGFDRRRARDFQWLFTNERVKPAAREHALDAMMGFATHLGASERPLRWDIALDRDALAFAAAEIDGHSRSLIISPCSTQRSRNYRNWSADNYAAIADYAHDSYDCRTILTGGPTALEREYGASVCTSANTDVRNLVGKTSLKQLLALFASADVLVCPDSGPAHMATTVETPVIGLYATSNPGRTGPYLSPGLTVNRYPDAARRYLGHAEDDIRWGKRVRHPDAMDLITIDDVKAKIDDVFGA